MAVRAAVRRSFYQDSIVLMGVAARLRGQPGVREAAALMGTPANRALLAAAGLAAPEVDDAAPGDLVIAVEAESDAAATAALAAAGAMLEERSQASSRLRRPRTLEAARGARPDANLAVISVPGAYAALEARTALRHGLNVFLFSDNVPLAEEVELKRLAASRRLLCMGPDCGTAYLAGVGLGFANVVPRGRIGCVAASGTGLQAVVSRLAALGEGVSHGIGVGGRDLSAEVGGTMTTLALAALARDARTEAIVVISKPAAAAARPALEAAVRAAGKPVVVCCLGAAGAGAPGTWVSTLEDAADAVVAQLCASAWSPRAFSDPGGVRARAAALGPARGTLLGLYTGGTLAHEAHLLLEPALGPIGGNVGAGRAGHRILDLGADELTVGRPHPMLDPEARAARVREAARDGAVGVLLLDVVLGRGAHPDPAGVLAAAVRDARQAAGRPLLAVASVVGTEADPQRLSAQVDRLRAAGVEVLPSSAQAARFAALALRPELDPASR
ncbi:MAG TPA: acyl-CoA synthetase FdrA [Methylomirabilota bacterium]